MYCSSGISLFYMADTGLNWKGAVDANENGLFPLLTWEITPFPVGNQCVVNKEECDEQEKT